MKAFDTDVLTELLLGNVEYGQRASLIPPDQQSVPILVVEEIIRGRLNVIRQAEAGKARIPVERAYELFERTLQDMRKVTVLSHTSQAESLFQQWRALKLRLST